MRIPNPHFLGRSQRCHGVRVEEELIRRIGPLGTILVARATKTADSPSALGQALAEHIADETQRASFLDFIAALEE